MKLEELTEYLKRFEISDENIVKIIKNKKVIQINENIFLTSKEFEKNQISQDTIIFIKLKKLLPTTYLLNIIKENTNNIIKLESKKTALNFTYSKNLTFENIPKNFKLKSNYDYLVLFENTPIGIAKLNKKDKKFPVENIMNIGEYLKEN